jgi:uncharacterized membrane protein YjfL (UPF0719 family)
MMASVSSIGITAIAWVGMDAAYGLPAPVYFGWAVWFFVMWLLDYRMVKLVIAPIRDKKPKAH